MALNFSLMASDACPTLASVTDADLWRAVGAELQRLRTLADRGSTFTFKQAHHDAPAIGTMDTIERGRPGRVENIERYCKALGTTTADVIRRVLDAADGLGPSFTDAELALVELFRAIPEGKPRAAWLELGRFVAEKADADHAPLDDA